MMVMLGGWTVSFSNNARSRGLQLLRFVDWLESCSHRLLIYWRAFVAGVENQSAQEQAVGCFNSNPMPSKQASRNSTLIFSDAWMNTRREERLRQPSSQDKHSHSSQSLPGSQELMNWQQPRTSDFVDTCILPLRPTKSVLKARLYGCVPIEKGCRFVWFAASCSSGWLEANRWDVQS